MILAALVLCTQSLAIVDQVLATDAHLTLNVAGLERTSAKAEIVRVEDQPFSRALRVTIKDQAQETNATQLTLANAKEVKQGDTLLASLWLRGPGQVEFLFEKSTDPWTKSVTRGITLGPTWKRTFVAFKSAQAYKPGEAMASLRLAFQPQTIEVGDLSITNYGTSRTLDQLVEYATSQSPIGNVSAIFDFKKTQQTMMGFGGNFAQPRYGATEAMDTVGQYALDHLNVVHARVGLPLNHWAPEPGVYKDEAQAKASLEQLAVMAKRKIPTVVSVWEGPLWMLPGTPETARTLAPENYKACIEAIAQYLVTARDKYKATPEYFSFNEPDYGVNFKFTPEQMIDFIAQAGVRFDELKLKTKFLVADTASGSNTVSFATPLLNEPKIAKYLGPIAFHNWDSLSASEANYKAIAELGRKYKKPLWCLEAGHDAQLWQNPTNPWQTWENALRLAMSYERTLRLTDSVLLDYWTYQDNYPLINKFGPEPYPVFHVLRQMEEVFSKGSKVVEPVGTTGVQALASVGPGKRLSVLVVNPEGPGDVRLGGFTPKSRLTVLTSTSAEQMARTVAVADAGGAINIPLPMRSVVTIRG